MSAAPFDLSRSLSSQPQAPPPLLDAIEEAAALRGLQRARATITTARRQAEELTTRHQQLTTELQELTGWWPTHRVRCRELEVELPAVECELGEPARITEPVSQAGPALAAAARASEPRAIF